MAVVPYYVPSSHSSMCLSFHSYLFSRSPLRRSLARLPAQLQQQKRRPGRLQRPLSLRQHLKGRALPRSVWLRAKERLPKPLARPHPHLLPLQQAPPLLQPSAQATASALGAWQTARTRPAQMGLQVRLGGQHFCSYELYWNVIGQYCKSGSALKGIFSYSCEHTQEQLSLMQA